MKVIIPDDWDGEDWSCIRIQWPNSPQWMALLLGLVTTPTRGRWYDETTGNIKSAQAVGAQIFERNFPWAFCDESQTQTVTEIRETLIQAGITIEGETMGQVVTDVQYVNGKLRVFYGHCCYEDIELSLVGDTEEVVEPTLPDWPDDIDPPAPDIQYYACGKINGLVDTLTVIGQAAWNNRTTPYDMRAAILAANPGYSVSLTNVTALYVAALGLSAIELLDDADIFNTEFLEDWMCFGLGMLANDIDGFSATEWAAFSLYPEGHALWSEPPDLGAFFDVYAATFWTAVCNVLGRERANQIMALHATQTGDCAACFETPFEWGTPNEDGYVLGDVVVENADTVTDDYWTHVCIDVEPDYDVFGFVVDIGIGSGADSYKFSTATDCGNDLLHEGSGEATTYKTIFVAPDEAIKNDLLPLSNWYDIAIDKPPVDLVTPVRAAGSTYSIHFEIKDMTTPRGAAIYVRNVRLLHNINSATAPTVD
jgi:hypothetical protein